MFNSRQLLALSTLLKSIDEEENQVLKEMLLSGFQSLLNDNNLFVLLRKTPQVEGIFTRHDYAPKMRPCENNVFGVRFGKNTWVSRIENTIEAKVFQNKPIDRIAIQLEDSYQFEDRITGESIN